MIGGGSLRGRNSLIYTGPEGKPGGESRFPLSLKTDGVLKIQSYYYYYYYFFFLIIFFFKGPLGAFVYYGVKKKKKEWRGIPRCLANG
jgi:hypothetical protein